MDEADHPDALLATRAAEGDADAFARLVRRHTPFLIAFATRLMGSRADADDCVQDALITVWERLPELREPASVRAWMARIVSRQATDRLRARRPQVPIDAVEIEASDRAEERAELGEQLTALSRLLGSMPEDMRTVWLLREVAGSSYEEIADVTGVSASTVRGRLSRARVIIVEGMRQWR